jgi:hypothetical protein
MRTLLVGDVHGCSDALGRLLDQTAPDRVLLLGDLFTKGPDPLGVWAHIVRTRAEAILGNHDARMLQVWDDAAHGDGSAHRACRALPREARDWTAALPLFVQGEGWLAVHAGVHPTLGAAGTDRRTALVVRRWPDDTDHATPFWWQLYTGAERIFYGHDAMRGVQAHARTTGLDSGCVYGGPLSGWLLEEDRLVQVEGGR